MNKELEELNAAIRECEEARLNTDAARRQSDEAYRLLSAAQKRQMESFERRSNALEAYHKSVLG